MSPLPRLLLAPLALALFSSTPQAYAQSLDSGSVMEAVHNLKPGQYLWAPQLAPAGPMLLVIKARLP